MRKAYSIIFKKDSSPVKDWTIQNPEIANKIIYDALATESPCMIARFGANEMATLVNYLGIQNSHHNIWKLITGKQPQWWWNGGIIRQMEQNAGFFPTDEENLSKFSKLLLEDAKYLDILGSWLEQERTILKYMNEPKLIHLHLLEPFWSQDPWTRALKGKRILVVHPFANTIRVQYEKRTKLFSNPDVLPEFASLNIIPAVQSIGGDSDRFHDWFKALEWMKNEIDKQSYDICLIGCGAYGFNLAAHVKRQGKQAIHLGGALQLLFGIKGKRWEDPNYGVKEWGLPIALYSNLCDNPYWIRPKESETPQSAHKVENGCYW